jgi:hypothetical protein
MSAGVQLRVAVLLVTVVFVPTLFQKHSCREMHRSAIDERAGVFSMVNSVLGRCGGPTQEGCVDGVE